MKLAGLAPTAMERLMNYHWPGNIRELGHAIESSYNMIDLESEMIEMRHLPHYLQEEKARIAGVTGAARKRVFSAGRGNSAAADAAVGQRDLSGQLKQLEREAIVQALAKHQYNITLAAQSLGLKRQALQYKMGRYGIVKK
jgi:arginine utilization regulatory protein